MQWYLCVYFTEESVTLTYYTRVRLICIYLQEAEIVLILKRLLIKRLPLYNLFLGITLTLGIAINLRLLHCTPIKSFHKKFRILAAVYSKVKSLCSVSNQRWALSQIYRKYNHCFKLQCNPDYPNSLGPSKSSDNRGCTVVCFAC